MDKLYLEVKTPEKIIFKGDITSMSSVNDSGPFDILTFHANFFSIIKEKILVLDNNQKKTEITIKEKGILRVMDNKIFIFLGIETLE